MSDIVKVSIPEELKVKIKERANNLGISVPEYFRTLANLDISTKNYQEVAIYINVLYNRINDYHKMLDIHCTPLQDIPIVNFEEIST